MNKEKIIEIAKENKFELSEKEVQEVLEFFNKEIEEMDKLDKVDTKGYEPIFSVHQDEIHNVFGKIEEQEKRQEEKEKQETKDDIEVFLDREKMVDDYYNIPK